MFKISHLLPLILMLGLMTGCDAVSDHNPEGEPVVESEPVLLTTPVPVDPSRVDTSVFPNSVFPGLEGDALMPSCSTHCAVWSTNQGVYYGYVTNCGAGNIYTAFSGGYDHYVQLCT